MNGATRVAPFNKEYYKGDYIYIYLVCERGVATVAGPNLKI